MKTFIFSLSLFLILTSCNTAEKKSTKEETIAPLTVAEKIANAHGFENWKNVKRIDFTFNVEVNNQKGKGRHWTWHPKTNDVTMISNDTITYNRRKIDNTAMGADRGFVNDKFWLLIPFQLVWDSSATITEPKKAESPIHKETLDMITITYSNKGGYTPGDAYDIYYDQNYMIKEWSFRQGNSAEPSLSNTFENYQDFNGIKIALDHKKDNGNWNLFFSDVEVTLK
ncbi:MAG: hypothetical protein HRU50_08790 [Winogradskyella sp.]|uniref:hypothetical protein n=1 Tax=Winogradskyella sp. TaxID=1883156 RepID=UPI0025F2ABDB|nr:hypothetical protein [Winogradskyella sp.]NRB60014.1 hypothetical protein [Winogradskyella sp.]